MAKEEMVVAPLVDEKTVVEVAAVEEVVVVV